MGLIDSRPRRYLAAGSFAATVALITASNFLVPEPSLDGTGSQVMRTVAAQAGNLSAGTWIDIVYGALVVVAAMTIPMVVTGRGSAIVLVGCLFAAIGNLSHPAVATLQTLALSLSSDPVQGARVWDALMADRHLVPIVLTISIYPLGWLIMGAGLALGRVIPWWSLALPVIGIVISQTPLPHADLVLLSLFSIYAAVIAVRLALGEPDQAGGIDVSSFRRRANSVSS
jgi:hypothetical protein